MSSCVGVVSYKGLRRPGQEMAWPEHEQRQEELRVLGESKNLDSMSTQK